MALEASETITVKGEGITLTLLIWRRFKRKPRGYVERVLDANPGLSDSGPFLPVGAQVKLPLGGIAAATGPGAGSKVVSIWD